MTRTSRDHNTRGRARRALLLDAAIAVIAEQGLEGATHRAIATRAGVPLSATSYFFASLDELVGAAVTQIADTVLASAESLVAEAEELGADAPVEQLIDRLVELLGASGDQRVRVQFEAYLACARRPDLQPAVERIVDAYESAVGRVLSAIGVRDPRRAARELLHLTDGAAILRIARPRADDFDVLRGALTALVAAQLRRPAD